MHFSLKALTLTFLTATLTIAVSSESVAAYWWHSAGPVDGYSAAPPDFQNCSNCHTQNPVNDPSGFMQISGLPTEYMPGQAYTITITEQRTGAMRWGFQLLSLDSSLNNIGDFNVIDSGTQKTSTAGRTYVKHNSSGTHMGVVDGPVSWTTEWVAPAAGAGTVTLYAAGNTANANFNTIGDFIYTAAISSAESGAVHEDLSLRLQPDANKATVFRGEDAIVRARIRNHSQSAQSALLVSRVILPNGNPYPGSGYLLPPISVSLAAGEAGEYDLIHSIPANVPTFTVTYEGYLGTAPSTILAQDQFTLIIRP